MITFECHHRWGGLPILFTLTVSVTGCALFGASPEVAGPTLEVPEAPPRIVADFPAQEVSSDESVTDQEPLAAAPVVDPPPSAVVAPPPPPPDVATTPPPPTNDDAADRSEPLQLAPTTEQSVDTEMVSRRLRGTARILAAIDRTTLGATGRAQHDTARRFLNQARAALSAGNLTFAHYLNEKAETLARDLGGR